MSVIDQITELMLREGEIKAQQAREAIAAQEERKRHKDRWRRWTLKALATIGPMFIPGVGPFGGLASGLGQNVVKNTIFKNSDGGWEY